MAARKNRRTGRFSKSKRRTSRKKFSIGKAAETALVANAAIGGIFGTTLPTFLTGRSFAGTGFGTNNVNNSWELTLPEMADMLMGGKGGMNSKTFQGGIGTAIRKNLKENWISTVGQLVVIPLAFKFGRKVLAKPLINPTNRMLKTAGLGEVKI